MTLAGSGGLGRWERVGRLGSIGRPKNDTLGERGSQEENHKILWLGCRAGRKMWWFGDSGLVHAQQPVVHASAAVVHGPMGSCPQARRGSSTGLRDSNTCAKSFAV